MNLIEYSSFTYLVPVNLRLGTSKGLAATVSLNVHSTLRSMQPVSSRAVYSKNGCSRIRSDKMTLRRHCRFGGSQSILAFS